MEIFIGLQLKSLAESCIMGLIFGAGYDIIRILHVLWGIASYTGREVPENGHPKVRFALFFLADIVYMLTVTFFYSVFLYHESSGQFRLFLALACIAGFILYHRTAGRLVMQISETIVSWLKRLIRFFIIRPVLWILHLLKRTAKILWHAGPGNLIRLCRRGWYRRKMRRSMRNFPETVRL